MQDQRVLGGIGRARLSWQAIGYLFTGGAAAIVDVGGFWGLHAAGLAIAPAAILSFCLAAVVNYLLTSRFVFSQRAGLRRFALFFAFALVGLTINASVTTAVALLGVFPVLAKVAGVAVAFVANFLMNALIVFRTKA
jgi:putative flippase GtrA